MENEERAGKAKVVLATAEMTFKDELIIHVIISKENEMVIVSNVDDVKCATTLKNVVTELDRKLMLENEELKKELDSLKSKPEVVGEIETAKVETEVNS
jgi:regulator of replication initiation timing